MDANVWEGIYEKLVTTYPNVSCVDIAGIIGVILKLPDGHSADNLVSHMKLTVMGVGVCARISTYYKGVSMDDIQRLLQDGVPLPDEGVHVVVVKRVVDSNLMKIANGLGARFTEEEIGKIETVCSLMGPWTLHMIGERLLAFGVSSDLSKRDDYEEIIKRYTDVMWELFGQKASRRQTDIDIKDGRRLWFGDMRSGC